MIRVRFAPSPTGPLHIGGVRTALYNYLFAKANKGTFILRIEDTDQKRSVPEAEQYIKDSLKWLGITPEEGEGQGGDFGPYKQSERKDIYRQYVWELIHTGKAYLAFETAEELEIIREKTPNWKYDFSNREALNNSLNWSETETKQAFEGNKAFVVRLKLNADEVVTLNDKIRGTVSINTNELDDKVIYKSDGLPTYHLANVVDDYLMKITHVIRGEEWLPSTPIHVLLYRAFGWENVMPSFAHLPLILKPEGNGKLSKRDGDKFGFPVFPIHWKTQEEEAKGFSDFGFSPEALINFLAFLGWNPGTEKEIYNLSELVNDFSLERVNKSGARFDFEKAKWFNQKHIQLMDNVKIEGFLKQQFTGQAWLNHPKLALIIKMFKDRVVFLEEFESQSRFLWGKIEVYDEKTIQKKWKDQSPEMCALMVKCFAEIEDFSSKTLADAFGTLVEKQAWGFGNAMISLRLALTGMGSGPDLFDIMEVLSKKVALQRIESSIPKINEIKEVIQSAKTQ